jgi:DUF1680 family protein
MRRKMVAVTAKTKYTTIPLKDVQLTSGFLAQKQRLIRDKVVPYQWKALNDEIPGAEPSHAIQNFRIAAGEAEGEFRGMVFQDSDVAKWLEAAAYILAAEPDEHLEQLADGVIDLIERAQRPDGYLNTCFILSKPNKEWTNVAEYHELYCAGHMLEAAIAYHQATGKRKLLDVMLRFVDHIDAKFGPEEGKLKAYPGHQEIELALVKLHRLTGEERYLQLAKYFIDERGQEPNYFKLERETMEEDMNRHVFDKVDLDYYQAHKPVRQQTEAIGHAVRALYMYSAMIDIAVETGDTELIQVCERLWDNVTKRQMYITGGVGSSAFGEAFTFDYDLPNSTAYAETCASIALVFFAWRMLQLQPKSEYADVMERALYNGVLSGISADGEGFFYVNPLEVHPETCQNRYDHRHVKATRQRWFTCACCPPNLARLLTSIGQYVYLQGGNHIYVNLYTDSRAELVLENTVVSITQSTNYPWEGTVGIRISCPKPQRFVLALRIPGWCRAYTITVNGEQLNDQAVEDGYLSIDREWQSGDEVTLEMPMPVEKMRAHPKIRANAGKVCLQRGPLVYCLEEEDNGGELHNVFLTASTEFQARFDEDLFDGIVVIEGDAYRITDSDWGNGLYRPSPSKANRFRIKAIPYYSWANRRVGEMRVWINALESLDLMS